MLLIKMHTNTSKHTSLCVCSSAQWGTVTNNRTTIYHVCCYILVVWCVHNTPNLHHNYCVAHTQHIHKPTQRDRVCQEFMCIRLHRCVCSSDAITQDVRHTCCVSMRIINTCEQPLCVCCTCTASHVIACTQIPAWHDVSQLIMLAYQPQSHIASTWHKSFNCTHTHLVSCTMWTDNLHRLTCVRLNMWLPVSPWQLYTQLLDCTPERTHLQNLLDCIVEHTHTHNTCCLILLSVIIYKSFMHSVRLLATMIGTSHYECHCSSLQSSTYHR